MSACEPFRIGYVLAEYPSVTETFVANEIRGLLDCGASVTVLALRRGRGSHAPDCPVHYRDCAAPRDLSGAWRASLRLAREAVALERKSPSSLVYALRNVGTAFRFARLVRQAGIGHIHAHFGFIPTDVALMISRLEPVSVSFSAHAWDVYCQGRTLPGKVARAALCITCTEAARRHLNSLVKAPVRRKIVRVYHGTDLSRFAFEPRPEPSEPPRILAVGRLVPKKGFETLLRACNRLREEMPVCCEVVGGGPLEGSLRALAGELGLSEAVGFTGVLPYELMPKAYGRADVLAVPSVVAPDGDRDGLPNVVTEAMARGVPVVGSRLSGIPEAVEHGRTGLLCPPGDGDALSEALHRMLTDRPLRSRCTTAARELVEEKFDAARNSRQVFEAIKAVARARRTFTCRAGA